jgi:hypothetical protein
MLRNVTIKSLAILMLLAMFNSTSLAQNGKEKIKFPKGKNSVTLKRVLKADTGVLEFVFPAKKGRTIKFTVDGNADLIISLADSVGEEVILKAEPGQASNYKVANSGTHYIVVANRSSTNADITLKLSVN